MTKVISSSVKVLILFAYTCLLSVLGGLALFTKNGDQKYFFLARHWSRSILKTCGVKVQVDGIAKIKDARGIVYLANHASMFDIWALQAALPGQLRFIGKKELTRIPIFGWIWKYSGNIPFDRKKPKEYVRMLAKAAQTLGDGKCIILFPEGTRTKDGKLQEFKRGSFSVALNSKATIVPVTINGSFSILKKGSFIINPGLITLVIHDPLIPSGDWSGKERELEMLNAVRKIIHSAYINQS